MKRRFAWVARRVSLFYLVVAGLGLLFAGVGWMDRAHIRRVAADGFETTARIEGATIARGRGGSESYALKLSWRDAAGNLRTADKVTITGSLARQVLRGDRMVRDSVRIKYLPDARAASTPLVLDDVAAIDERPDNFLLTLGAALFAGAALGSLILFLTPRRRPSADAGHQRR